MTLSVWCPPGQNVTVIADDFLSIVPDGVDGPAPAGWQLPDIAFMRPKPGNC